MAAMRVSGVPAYRGPIVRTADDGTEKIVYLHGNEHFHYMTDQAGQWLEEKRLKPMTEAEKRARIEGAQAMKPHRAPLHEESIGDTPYLVPRVLVLLVNFADTKFSTPKDTIDSMLNGTHFTRDYMVKVNTGAWTYFTHITSSGSVQQYFHDQSYGQYNPVFDVVGPLELSQNASYYGQNTDYGKDANVYEMIKDACDKADSEGIDFRQYDSNNDGYVDLVYVLYAGFGEADGGPEGTIWPHQSDMSYYYYRHDGKYIGHYACSNELDFNNKLYEGVGTICHEFSHVLGLPDLYENNEELIGLHTLCNWDIMDQGSYNNDGNTPPAYSAYERFYMGWLMPRVLTDPEYVTLRPINEGEGESLLISSTNWHNLVGSAPSPATFYLLEDRKREGWDQHLPGEGMLITKISFNRSRWRTNQVNCSEQKMGIDILEAKENTTYIGRASDAFPAGTVNEWTSLTWHEITNISRSEEDGVIRFCYRGAPLPEDVEKVPSENEKTRKELHNGRIIIRRGNKTYDIMGYENNQL